MLIVTWLGGGATQPAIGLGRELTARGHRVHVPAQARFAGRIAAAGCEHAAHPAATEFDASHGRAMEDQSPFMAATFVGQGLAEAAAEHAAVFGPGVVVVDYVLAIRCLRRRGPAHPADRAGTHGAPLSRPPGRRDRSLRLRTISRPLGRTGDDAVPPAIS